MENKGRSEISVLMGLVAGEANKLRHSGMESKLAYETAIGKVADMNGITNVTAFKEQLSTLLTSGAKQGGRKRHKNSGKNQSLLRPYSVNAKYRDWVASHDFVPEDEILAHFTGLDIVIFEQARANLVQSGFEFTKSGHEFRVTDPIGAQIAQLEAQIESLKKKRIGGRSS